MDKVLTFLSDFNHQLLGYDRTAIFSADNVRKDIMFLAVALFPCVYFNVMTHDWLLRQIYGFSILLELRNTVMIFSKIK